MFQSQEEVDSQFKQQVQRQSEASRVPQPLPPSTDQSNQRNIEIKESQDQSKDEGETDINKDSSTSGMRYRGQEGTDHPLPPPPSLSPPPLPPSVPSVSRVDGSPRRQVQRGSSNYIVLFLLIVIVLVILLLVVRRLSGSHVD